MIRTIVRDHHWAPDQFGALFLDEKDIYGLEFWYNDSLELIDQVTEEKKKLARERARNNRNGYRRR